MEYNLERCFESTFRGGYFKTLINDIVKNVRKETNLRRVDIEIICYLYRGGDSNTLTDVCNYLQLNKGHISTALDTLDRDGYVTSKQDENDRRYNHYILTSKAVNVASAIEEKWIKMAPQLFEGISEKDFETFKRVSEQMSFNIEKMVK